MICKSDISLNFFQNMNYSNDILLEKIGEMYADKILCESYFVKNDTKKIP